MEYILEKERRARRGSQPTNEMTKMAKFKLWVTSKVILEHPDLNFNLKLKVIFNRHRQIKSIKLFRKVKLWLVKTTNHKNKLVDLVCHHLLISIVVYRFDLNKFVLYTFWPKISLIFCILC